MLSPIRLETYMRNAAMLGRDAVEIPPFVCLFNPGDPLRFFNYAKPLEPVRAESDGLSESLAKLREVFRMRGSRAALRVHRGVRARPGTDVGGGGVQPGRSLPAAWSARRRRSA